jgi:hypothetical protein
MVIFIVCGLIYGFYCRGNGFIARCIVGNDNDVSSPETSSQEKEEQEQLLQQQYQARDSDKPGNETCYKQR